MVTADGVKLKVRKRPRKTAQRTVYGGLVLQKNLPELPRFSDLYHWMLTTKRKYFLMMVAGIYLGTNLIFALAYMLSGGIENMRDGSFQDAFFFSVQTLATIGYGRMVPLSTAANLLVTAEAGLGLFAIAMAASLMFARFTRATAGVRFSRNALITRFDGKAVLAFRIANERQVRINEARISLVMARQQMTAEGQEHRKLIDLVPARSTSPVFELSWTVMHVIDESSPLFGSSAASLADSHVALTIVFSGHHDGFQQQVHARYTYTHDQIIWGHRFADMIKRPAEGPVVIDYALFDELIPLET